MRETAWLPQRISAAIQRGNSVVSFPQFIRPQIRGTTSEFYEERIYDLRDWWDPCVSIQGAYVDLRIPTLALIKLHVIESLQLLELLLNQYVLISSYVGKTVGTPTVEEPQPASTESY